MGIESDQGDLGLGPRLDASLILAFADPDSFGAALGDLLIYQLDSSLDRLRCGALQVGVKCGVDAVCLFVNFSLRYLADDSVANQIDEVGSIARFDIRGASLSGVALALSACSLVMARVSTMLSSTILRRSVARSGWR